MSAMWPVHVALVARLKATAGVTALVGQRIHDGQAPQGETFPYIVIDSQTGNVQRSFERDGDRGTTNINIWSRYQGLKEAAAIEAAVKAALRTPVTATGWGAVRIKWEQTRPITEGPDTRRIILQCGYFVLSETVET